MIKIVAISDTHGLQKKFKDRLPEGDVIIHAGDCTNRGEHWEVKAFIEWYGSTNYNVKILVPGNHDFLFEEDPEQCQYWCKENGVILLNDSGITLQMLAGYPYINKNIPGLDKINIWGSPVTPWFNNWAFNRSVSEAQENMYNCGFIQPHWDKIPKDTDILITHGPPYEILDELCFVDGTPKGQFVGCPHLARKVKEIKPDLHFFGHIHCAVGEKHLDGTSYYNVAICDEMYYPGNEIKVIEYEKF